MLSTIERASAVFEHPSLLLYYTGNVVLVPKLPLQGCRVPTLWAKASLHSWLSQFVYCLNSFQRKLNHSSPLGCDDDVLLILHRALVRG